MGNTYSVYEAKARFSELIKKVRSGQRLIITHRGREVAELRPIQRDSSLQQRLADLEEAGIISGPTGDRMVMGPIVERPGALARFIEERE
ncbi:MAG: type II toxin-antitoxin system prevent-host-death family antitoxin [Bradymonadales bacterium]|nr:type II toxin-antitoxin system prevent-host-death family antitoxin [Bradymonadales bacterium]